MESGEFDPVLDPRHLLVQVIGLCRLSFSIRHLLKHMVGLNFSSAGTLTDGLDRVQHLISQGMKPSPTNT